MEPPSSLHLNLELAISAPLRPLEWPCPGGATALADSDGTVLTIGLGWPGQTLALTAPGIFIFAQDGPAKASSQLPCMTLIEPGVAYPWLLLGLALIY